MCSGLVGGWVGGWGGSVSGSGRGITRAGKVCGLLVNAIFQHQTG